MKRARHLALIAIDGAVCGALLTGRLGGGDDGEGIPQFQDVGNACTEQLLAVYEACCRQSWSTGRR